MPEPILCPQCGSEIPSGSPAGLCPKCLVLAGLESEPPAKPEPQPTQPSPPAGAAAGESGSGFVPPTVEEVASKFPQLEILALLGRGGMGAVYKARQAGLDRLVALKILPPEVGRDPAFAERFTREARALARLSHPNIVAIYDFGGTPSPPAPLPKGEGRPDPNLPSPFGRGAGCEGNTLFYFIMEYVDGVNLRQAIQSGGMNAKQALAIVPQICDALQFAHDEGIVHRDIKPENILIDKRGRVKIADFGLAKLLGQDAADHGLTGTQQVMGTLRYMAPEQMEGAKAVDHRADIYSLGVVFYELLTGELPIGRFAPPSKKVEIDVRLDEVVLRALEHEPELRYQHASEVKTDMETIARGREPMAWDGAAVEESPAEESPLEAWWLRQSRTSQRVFQAVLILFCSICMIGFLTVNQGMEPLPAGGTHTYLRIGVWDPWYRKEWQDGQGGAFALNFISGSFLLGVAAVVSFVLSLKTALWERKHRLGRAPQRATGLDVSVGPQAGAVGRGSPGPAEILDRMSPALAERPAVGGAARSETGRNAGSIGLISLCTSLGGLVLPVGLGLLGSLLANVLHLSEGYFVLCLALGIVLELAAFGCGIAAIRTTSGKAGLIVSSISLALFGFAFLSFSVRSQDTKRPAVEVVTVEPTFSEPQTMRLETDHGANPFRLHPGKRVPATPAELNYILSELPDSFTKGLLGSDEKSIKDLDTLVCAIDFDDGPADFWLWVQETGQETCPFRFPSRKTTDVWRIPTAKAHILMWIQPSQSVAMSTSLRTTLGHLPPSCHIGIDVDGIKVARINYEVPLVGQEKPNPLWFGWESTEMQRTDAGFNAEMASQAIYFAARKPSSFPAIAGAKAGEKHGNLSCQLGLMYRPDRVSRKKTTP